MIKQQWPQMRVLLSSLQYSCKNIKKRQQHTPAVDQLSDRNEKVVNTQKRSVPLLWDNDFGRRRTEQRTGIDHRTWVQLKYELNSYLQKKSPRVRNKPNKDSSLCRLQLLRAAVLRSIGLTSNQHNFSALGALGTNVLVNSKNNNPQLSEQIRMKSTVIIANANLIQTLGPISYGWFGLQWILQGGQVSRSETCA